MLLICAVLSLFAQLSPVPAGFTLLIHADFGTDTGAAQAPDFMNPFASLDNLLNHEFIVSLHGPATLVPLGSHRENAGSSEIRERD